MAGTRVLVVGAGVNGLSCAVRLLEAGADVVVRTAEQPHATVSAIAGAMLGPALGGTEERRLAWEHTSDRVFRELAEQPGTGIRVLRGRVLWAAAPPEGPVPWPRVPGFVEELRGPALPGGFAAGFVAHLPVGDMRAYLSWLVARVERLGGRIEQGQVSLDEVGALGVDSVVDCAGLGAADLVGEQDITPAWGQHVVVDAPSVTEFVLELGAGDAINVVPHGRGVLVGRVRRPGRDTLETDEAIATETVRRAARVLPELATAPVLGLEVGLRPSRASVRLEREERDGVRVVHNYGHDGNGAYLSWGCAADVVELCR